jgi:hypothetical protein
MKFQHLLIVSNALTVLFSKTNAPGLQLVLRFSSLPTSDVIPRFTNIPNTGTTCAHLTLHLLKVHFRKMHSKDC